MRIGELARQSGVDVQTIRYYERERLLAAPSRQASGYRVYRPEHLEQLNFIRHCRSLDMPLADIRRVRLLAGEQKASCEAVDALVDAHLQRVRAKLASLRRLERQLSKLRAQCSSGHRTADCGIVAELMHAAHGESCACHPAA
jgi:Cd(II)/Pb(II)-responsive transcriptional regulator